METIIISGNSESNRATSNYANALVIRAYQKEDSFRKQKSGIKWYVEGEVNSKFYHFVVNGRKNILTLKKIRKDDGEWIEGDDDIANEVVDFFQKQFTWENHDPDLSIINCIPKLITDEDNKILIDPPTMDEVKDAIFSICAQGAPSPNEISGEFYQSCWDIIKNDLLLIDSWFLCRYTYSQGPHPHMFDLNS